MADAVVLDRAFHTVITDLVATGRAPHYTELAAALGCGVEEGRQVLHDLMGTGVPAWLHPGTDYVASFAPLNPLPTQYLVVVGGAQKWYAQ